MGSFIHLLKLPPRIKVGIIMVKKTTVQLIQEVAGLLEDTMTSCSSEKKRSVISKRLTNLKESVSTTLSHLTDNEKRKFIDVRKNLKAVFNIIDGTLEGLSSGDMSRSEFRGTLNTLRTRFYPNVCSSLSVEIEKEEANKAKAVVLSAEQESLKAALSKSADMKEALTVVKQAVKTQDATSGPPTGEITDVATVTQLHGLAQMREKLPTTFKTDFQLIRMPIVPIFSNYQMNNPKTFKDLGIEHVLIEGYAVLLDQVLVAISEAKAKRVGLTPLAYAESVVSLVNEKSGRDYEFVSDQPVGNPRKADIQMYWVLPKPKMSALMRIALSGRNASTVKWGLPF
jgi:hypothetical protein